MDLRAVDDALDAMAPASVTGRPRRALVALLQDFEALAGVTPTAPVEPAVETFVEPAPMRFDPAPRALASLPPSAQEHPEDSVVPAPMIRIAPAEGLREPSLAPPRRDEPEVELRLSLPPLEPDPAPVMAIPRSAAPEVSEVVTARPSFGVEALELDLSVLGPSEAPALMPKIPPASQLSSAWAVAEEEIERLDDLEVMELDEVRVARDAARAESAPPLPPTRPAPRSAGPPSLPPGLRKIR